METMDKILEQTTYIRKITILSETCRIHPETHLKRVDPVGAVVYCETCSKEKEKLREQQDKEDQEVYRRNKISRSLYQMIGIEATEKPYQEYQFTPDTTQVWKQLIQEEVDPDIKGFYLFGDKGTGKTLLAKLIVRYWLHRGKRAEFLTAHDLEMKWLSNEMKDHDQSIYQLANIDLLVIDDLGRNTTTSKMFSNLLFSLINRRFENRFYPVKTIITSNLSVNDLGELKIYETDRFKLLEPVEFRGRSRRCTPN